jgi:hypothetical protein
MRAVKAKSLELEIMSSNPDSPGQGRPLLAKPLKIRYLFIKNTVFTPYTF